MIDKLFGSKTRVKLLHLFMNNPDKSFYVREITRIVGEQINSVRRELANMVKVGIVVSDSADNKLYYKVNQRYDHYVPLKAIFSDDTSDKLDSSKDVDASWQKDIESLRGVKVAISSGVLSQGSSSDIDLLVAGNMSRPKLKSIVADIEKIEGRELNYTCMTFDEFYYRLSVRDRFILDIINNKHTVLVDTDKLL